MTFKIEGKVALVTGGASGIGLDISVALLRNGLKGITLADFNPKLAEKTLEQLSKEFDLSRIQFVKTDVTNPLEFENAFEKTVERFGNIDILVNNAGIFRDGIWEKQIDLNVTATARGTILGLHKYLPKYQQGPEALIINISSVNGFEENNHIPVYCGTKLAVVGFGRAWGHPAIYEKTKVKVVTICPGPTVTPAVMAGEVENDSLTLGEMYLRLRRKNMEYQRTIRQTSDYLADEIVKVVKQADNGSVWCIENRWPSYQYFFPDRSEMKKNTLQKYIK